MSECIKTGAWAYIEDYDAFLRCDIHRTTKNTLVIAGYNGAILYNPQFEHTIKQPDITEPDITVPAGVDYYGHVDRSPIVVAIEDVQVSGEFLDYVKPHMSEPVFRTLERVKK